MTARPKTRAECPPERLQEGGFCPYVGCRYHLLSEKVDRYMKLGNRGTLIPSGVRDYLERMDETEPVVLDLLETIPETCALDVADRGGHTLGAVAHTLRLPTQAIQQMQAKAARKIAAAATKSSDTAEVFETKHRHQLVPGSFRL